jgi:hypothetical protein
MKIDRVQYMQQLLMAVFSSSCIFQLRTNSISLTTSGLQKMKRSNELMCICDQVMLQMMVTLQNSEVEMRAS